jgi:hypothetical protein
MGMTWLAALLLAVTARAADWPTYRHDNARSGATVESLALPLTQVWAHRSAGTPKSAWAGEEGRTIEGKRLADRTRFDDALQAAIVGDRVFYGSSVDHTIYCRKLASGELVWRHVTGGP